MDHFVVTAWVGTGALYVLIILGIVDGYRHHLQIDPANRNMTTGELIVFFIYFLVVITSIIQEGVIYRAVTGS